MKRILFLLSLTGTLLANQSIVITFGTEDANACSSNTAKGIFSNPDSLTYNIVTACKYFNIYNIVNTHGSTSSISVSFASSTDKDDYISTKSGNITSIGGDNSAISSIFGQASINGVLMSTNDSNVVITFAGLSAGTYTLYALGARGSKGITDGNTSYTLHLNQNISELSCNILAYGGNTEPKSENNVIKATTYNSSSDISNWVLMEYSFTTNSDNSSIDFQSYGHDGNIAAIALLAHSIPEPATATLSLLALTALAARRRRK